jgi:hypothetical protein
MRIECILLKFHWGMKALIELHFQHEARYIENVLRSTLSYPNESSKECIQFLNERRPLCKDLKGNNSCETYSFRIKVGNVQLSGLLATL